MSETPDARRATVLERSSSPRSRLAVAVPAWLLAALLPGMGFPTLAQEDVPPLSADRPGETNSPVVVPKGYVQLETGFQATRDEEDGDVEKEALEILDSTIRIGLARRVELRLSWLPYNEISRESGGTRITESGTGDAEIAAKLNLAEQKGARPRFGLIAGTTLPVGDDEFTSDRFDPTLVFLFENGLTDTLAFGYTLGVERATVASALGQRETNNELVYTGSLGIAAARDVDVFVELYGARQLDREAGWKVAFDTGVTWLVRPRFQLDLSVGHGLSDLSADRFVAFGLTVRFPR